MTDIQYYVEQLNTTKSEDAYFALLHADDAHIPDLITAYHHSQNTNVKDLLVEIIYQHRNVNSLSFLKEVFQETTSDLWKVALDGIVTTGSNEGLEFLKVEKERALQDSKTTRIEWIDEAIQQINESLP